MLNNTSNENSAKRYSHRSLEAGIGYVNALIAGTEDIITYHKVLMEAVKDGRIPGDLDSMQEVEQIFVTLNRLMYEEHSKIMHVKMMQQVEKNAVAKIKEERAAAAERAAAHRAAKDAVQSEEVKPSNE